MWTETKITEFKLVELVSYDSFRFFDRFYYQETDNGYFYSYSEGISRE